MDDDELIQQVLKEVKDELRTLRQEIATLQQFRWMMVGGLGVIIVLILPILADLFLA